MPWNTSVGDAEPHVERVVARGVLVEREADVARLVARVVEHAQSARPAPFVDAVLAELAQAVAAEVERRREQHQAVDRPPAIGCGRVHGHERAEARADQRDAGLRPTPRRESPRAVCSSIRVTVSDSKSGSLKSGQEKPTPRAASSRAKQRRLGRSGRRGEAVQIDDVSDESRARYTATHATRPSCHRIDHRRRRWRCSA